MFVQGASFKPQVFGATTPDLDENQNKTKNNKVAYERATGLLYLPLATLDCFILNHELIPGNRKF